MNGLRIHQIPGVVSSVTGVSEIDIFSPLRNPAAVRARFLVASLAREFTPSSYPQIAAALGMGDHTTALNAVIRATMLREADPGFADDWNLAAALLARLGQVGLLASLEMPDARRIAARILRDPARQSVAASQRDVLVMASWIASHNVDDDPEPEPDLPATAPSRPLELSLFAEAVVRAWGVAQRAFGSRGWRRAERDAERALADLCTWCAHHPANVPPVAAALCAAHRAVDQSLDSPAEREARARREACIHQLAEAWGLSALITHPEQKELAHA